MFSIHICEIGDILKVLLYETVVTPEKISTKMVYLTLFTDTGNMNNAIAYSKPIAKLLKCKIYHDKHGVPTEIWDAIQSDAPIKEQYESQAT